jgi:hypothetical protein
MRVPFFMGKARDSDALAAEPATEPASLRLIEMQVIGVGGVVIR